jgi:hypothetical protein
MIEEHSKLQRLRKSLSRTPATTVKPLSARRVTIDRPIPRDAPVTGTDRMATTVVARVRRRTKRNTNRACRHRDRAPHVAGLLKGRTRGNVGPKGLDRHQAQGKACQAAHCGVVLPLWRSGEFDRGDSLGQMADDLVCFHACQVGTQAVVNAAAKREVLDSVAVQAERTGPSPSRTLTASGTGSAATRPDLQRTAITRPVH